MATYKANMRERAGDGTKTDKQILGDLYDLYYNNGDFRLLLDLLATSSGVAPAIAIMALFDEVKLCIHYHRLWLCLSTSMFSRTLEMP